MITTRQNLQQIYNKEKSNHTAEQFIKPQKKKAKKEKREPQTPRKQQNGSKYICTDNYMLMTKFSSQKTLSG